METIFIILIDRIIIELLYPYCMFVYKKNIYVSK